MATTKAMKAALSRYNSSQRDVQTVDVSANFTHSVKLVDFLVELRKKGDLQLSLGLSSEAEGGCLRVSEGGRATLWFIQNGKEASFPLTASLTKRVVSLLGDRNFRAEFGELAGQEALREALPVIGSRPLGLHTESGAWFIY